MISRSKVWVCGLMTALCMAVACPAAADWRRAESENFIVYSTGDEGALRRYTRNLEIYDHLLRQIMGIPDDGRARRKLPIYLVSGRNGLVQINPQAGPNVAGTYFPTGEDIFAAAIQTAEQDFLLHEYFHHFSFQAGDTHTYPAWLIEGLAEYFMTAEISDESVAIGGYNENRVYGLFDRSWIGLDDLLTKRYSQVSRSRGQETFYPVAWLLTHWFMSDDTRRSQLAAYLMDIKTGTPSVEAMEKATGLSLSEIRQRLRAYRRLRIRTYTIDFPDTPMTVTRLPRSADDLLLIGQRLKVGTPEEDRAGTAALVRRLAARHPDDPFALLQLGHAELHFGDPEAGEAALKRLIELEPENVEALQFLATRHLRLAREDPDQAIAQLRLARGYLARAYAADENAFHTLQMLAESRQSMPDYPNENDLVTWDRAFQIAPQLASIRLGYGSALMEAKEFDSAMAVLQPLANSAHGGPTAEAAEALVEAARLGQSPLPDAELDAAAEASEQPVEPEGGAGETSPPTGGGGGATPGY